jgi:hypothetical protein
MVRRQGQLKANGKKAVSKPVCPKCDEIMNRTYKRSNEANKRAYVGIGWYCPNPTCDYIIKDFEELEDTEEGENET